MARKYYFEQFHANLYRNLMALCAEPDACFYYKDFTKDSSTYRIFNYRLSSYTEFLKPSAMECRGIMFEMKDDVPITMSAMPMRKFFNLGENPSTIGLDTSLNNIESIHYKADGSLISTYIHYVDDQPTLAVKSKGSISSDQAIAAMALLNRPENFELFWYLTGITSLGFTINMEYVAPTNRIVLGYEKEQLIVLSARDMNDGHEAGRNVFVNTPVYNMWVDEYSPPTNVDFIDSVAAMEGIEGFVVKLKDETRFKIKTTWYMTLHHTKDSVNSPRRLFECVINETTDDLKAMFAEDAGALNLIMEMEGRVIPKFNHMISVVEAYYEENKHLSRKDYAIKGQTIADGLFSLKMNKYLERPSDYKEFAIKHPEFFGIKQDDERNASPNEEE